MMKWNDFIDRWYDKQPTFEELCDKTGIDNVFSGTDVDEATQIALYDYFFDFELFDKESIFLRRFRERLNRYYGQYLEEVRILTVKKNMDPFVNQWFEDAKERNASRDIDGSITYGSKINDSHKSDTTNSGTETRNLESSVSATTSDTTENSGKNRQYNVAYPEANMDVTLGIDDLPNIDYINSEVDGLSKDSSTSNGTSNTNGTDSGTISNDGKTNVSSSSESAKTGSDTNKEKQSDASKEKWIRKGRDTSVQALLTTAVKAIEGTNALDFLISKLIPCFNTTLY